MELDDCILLGDNDCYIVNPNENTKSNKELADAKNKQASTFFSNGQYQNARNLYSEAIALVPDCAIYYANRAAANMSLNDLKTVEDDLNKALSLDSTYLKAYTRKFNYFFSIGEINKALLVIQQVEKLDEEKSFTNEMTKRIEFLKNSQSKFVQAMSNSDFRTALFCIDNILKTCPSSTHFKLDKASALAYLYRHEEVINIVDSILRTDSTNSDAYFVRGLSLFFQDNLDKAILHFQQALRTEPEHKKSHEYFKKAKSIKNLKEQAKESLEKNEFEKAIQFYRDALTVDSNHKIGNAKLHFNLSIVYKRQQKTQEALDEINHAIKLDENYDKAYMKRASLYEDLEMYEESVRDYELLHKKLDSRETKELLEKAKLLLKRSQRKNYYKILGITKTADSNEIKKAYRKKALEFHPDRHADADEEKKLVQEKKFKDVSEAYNCLIDPNSRNRYDNGYDDVNPSYSFNHNDAFRMFCNERLANNIFFNFERRF